MKKLFCVLTIFALIIAFNVPASAGNEGNWVFQNGTWKCKNGSFCEGNPGGDTNNGGSVGDITNQNKNTAIGVGVGIGVGIGGQGGQGGTGYGGNATIKNSGNSTNNIGNGFGNFSPSAKATIEKGAVDVDNNNLNLNSNKNTNLNTNLNSNKNTNLNTNLNKNTNLNTNIGVNKQGQEQDQSQGQLQGQSQSSKNTNVAQGGKAVNAGNKQTTEVVIEGDKYEASKMHIQGPDLMKSDAKLAEGKPAAAKTFGSIMEKMTSITYDQARFVSKDADDVEIQKALLGEKDFRTDTISIGDTSGVFMGYIYANSGGSDVNAAGMEGKALEAAMYAGMTGIKRVYKDSGKVASGKSWNVGLGGGASIITSGDSVAVAPNGGLGFGGAKASNELLPDMVFEVYFNADKVWMQKSSGSTRSSAKSDGYSAGGR